MVDSFVFFWLRKKKNAHTKNHPLVVFAVARRENWNAGTLEQQVPPPIGGSCSRRSSSGGTNERKKKRKQKREPKKPQTRKSNDSVAVLGFHGPGPFDEPVGCDHRQPLSLSLSLSLLLFDDRRHRRLKNEAKKKPKKCWPSCPTTPVSSDKDRGNNNKKNKLKSKIEIRFLEGEFVTEKVSLLVYTGRNRKRVGRSFLFFFGSFFFFKIFIEFDTRTLETRRKACVESESETLGCHSFRSIPAMNIFIF